MDYRPYILAGTFLLLLVAVVTFVVTVMRSRRQLEAANRYGYMPPEVAPARPSQPIDTDLAGLEVTVDAEAPSAALLTPLRTGEWMPPDSPAPADSLGGVSLEERIADFRPVPDVREPNFAVDAYQSWEVGDEASVPVAAPPAQAWAAAVPEVRPEAASDEGDEFGEEIRALLPSAETVALEPEPAAPEPAPILEPTPVSEPAPVPTATIPLLPASGVVPGALVPQSVPVIEAPALVVPPAVTIDPSVLARAIAEASAAAVAAAQSAVPAPAPSAEIAAPEPVIDLTSVRTTAPEPEVIPVAAPASQPQPSAPVPVIPSAPEPPTVMPQSPVVTASPVLEEPAVAAAASPVSAAVEAPTPAAEVQEWVDMVRETQGGSPRPTAVAPAPSQRPAVTVAPVAAPAPEPAAPVPAAHAGPRRTRPAVRVHGVEQGEPAPSGEQVRLAPAPRAAASRDQVEEIVMAAPVEMWFGDARVGVKAGTATYDRFRKYADVLLDDLKARKAQSR